MDGPTPVTHYYYYDGHRLIQHDIDDGTGVAVHRQYVYGPGYINELVAQFHDGQTTPYFVLQDANHNVIGLTDSFGALVEQYSYEPYGVRNAFEDGAGNAITTRSPYTYHGFQGMIFDEEVNLYYTPGRYYNPKTARWNQRDPNGQGLMLTSLQFNGGTIDVDVDLALNSQTDDGMNVFEFVGSGPTMRTDPAGLEYLDSISGLEFPDENFANDLLISRDFDDIYNSIVGNDFAYLGTQGAATFGSFWGGSVALLPAGAHAAAGISEGFSEFADYYAEQLIWAPVDGAFAGLSVFAKVTAVGTAVGRAERGTRTARTVQGLRHGTRFANTLHGVAKRIRPKLLTGNLKEGWIHIKGRHITGIHPRGRGHLFPRGVTRSQIGKLANVVVGKGVLVTKKTSRRKQTYEKRARIGGKVATIRAIVDAKDGNRLITIFPLRDMR